MPYQCLQEEIKIPLTETKLLMMTQILMLLVSKTFQLDLKPCFVLLIEFVHYPAEPHAIPMPSGGIKNPVDRNKTTDDDTNIIVTRLKNFSIKL